MKTKLKKNLVALLTVCMVGLVLVAFTPSQQKPWDVPAKYKSMKNPTKADAASVENGKVLYAKHCKSCHGTKGYGDGPKAMNLEAKIRSLASKEYKAQTMGEKYFKSFIGRDEMPNFEKKLIEEDDRWAIINYMETFK